MRPSGQGSPYDLTLAVYLSPLAAGRRVLWIGAPGEGPGHLEGVAKEVRVESVPMDDAPGGIASTAGGEVDLLVVPDAPPPSPERASWMDGMARLLAPGGVLVWGWTAPEAEVAPTRDAAQRMLTDRFDQVRVVGQAVFAAHALADLDATADDVMIDGILVDRAAQPPGRLLALCGGGGDRLDRYVLVPCAAGRVEATDGEAAMPASEVPRLEEALADRARAVRTLEREVERRGTLVRDLVERLRGLGQEVSDDGGGTSETPAGSGGDPDVAMRRALEAEAALAEARYRIDELESQILELHAEAKTLREASLEGTVRGLRSRVAELEEMRALAEGRLELMRMDVDALQEQTRRLEREKAEVRDQLELEIVRAQGAHFSFEDHRERAARRLKALEDEVALLRGERDGLRARLEDRERALASVRATATHGSESAASEAATREERDHLEQELEQLRAERDGLVTRLQMDLARAEASSRDAATKATRLEDENEQLRSAMVDASSAVDAKEALVERVQALEAAREQDLRALQATRDLLGGLPGGGEARQPHEITAVGVEAPAADAAPEDVRAQLRALQERATRLQEELDHERRARRQSEERASTAAAEQTVKEAERLRASLDEREAELERLRASLQGEQDGAIALRDACAEARQEIEQLLALATETGDPATAERLGAVLRVLSRA
jgi:hypothetical protein